MDADTVERIQDHFDRIRHPDHRLVRQFYATLFQRHPELRILFPQDLSQLVVHFEATLALVIEYLGRIGTVDMRLQELGVKHMGWGAQPHHYLAARDALLSALEVQSGEEWNRELANAWREAINALIVPMLRGAAVETARIAQRLAEELPSDHNED